MINYFNYTLKISINLIWKLLYQLFFSDLLSYKQNFRHFAIISVRDIVTEVKLKKNKSSNSFTVLEYLIVNSVYFKVILNTSILRHK